MTEGRSSFTLSLLPNGKTLAAGGFYLNTSELYDPTTGTWALTGNMIDQRQLPAAVVLPNGNVVVTGGYVLGDYEAAEVYHPTTGLWSSAGFTVKPHAFHTMTRLQDGRILIAGGENDNY